MIEYLTSIDWTVERAVSILSLLIAILAALYARQSAIVAGRATAIAEEAHFLQKDNLSLYLVEGINYVPKDGKYIFAFNIEIRNKSRIKNSVHRLDLAITFLRKDGSVGCFVLQHDLALRDSIVGHSVTPIELPMDIADKSAIAGWGLFLLDVPLKEFGRIEKYTVRVVDASENLAQVESYLIKEYRVV
ncbi:hypothetical protein [Pseudomonas triclosanedens]|nr:hypothetical protein [Pseudomonas triclosanedens]